MTGSLSRATGEDVGDYAISSTLANTNYTITFVPANLSITEKAITITADAKTKVYGDEDPALTYQITTGALVGTDALTGSLSRATGEAVGDYAISSTLANANYNITFVPANLSITEKAITITADAKTKVYGDEDPALTYQITTGALVGTDALTGSLSRTTGEAVGDYAISSTLANANYNITFVPANLSITEKAITITADAKSKVYGETDPALTYQITTGALVGTDALTGSLSRTTGEAVGDYAISSTLANANYNITFVPANLSITEKAITITADAKSKVYGETDPALTYQITTGALVGTDALTGSLSRAAGENVGDYAISSTLANTNYTITFVPADLSITEKAMTITADAKSKVYGQTDPALTYQITTGALVGTDALTGNLSRAAGETVGDYAISSTLANANYTITFESADLSITKKALTITADDKTKVYDGDVYSPFTVNYSGFITGEDKTNLEGTLAFSGTATTATAVNTAYVITPEGLTSSNYAITFANGALDITQQAQVITFGTLAAKTYGDAAFTLSATGGTSGNPVLFTSSDPSVATCTGTNGATVTIIGAGNCTITANQAGNANYSVADAVVQSLTVNKNAQTITFGALAAKTYGDANFNLTGTASSTLAVSYNSDNLAVATVSGTTVTIVGAGIANITASQAGDGNFNAATNVVQQLTVAKANQVLTLNALPVGTLALKDFVGTIPVTASSSASLAVTISLGSGSAATLNASNELESIGATGTVVINVDQAGNGNYNAAHIDYTFDVVVANQVITFPALTSATYAPGLTVDLTGKATSTSLLSVSYSVLSGPATVSGTTLSVTGAGFVVVQASQAGSVAFNPATDKTQTLIVSKATPLISSFAAITKIFDDAPFTLNATSASTGLFTYSSSDPDVATIAGSTVTIRGTGTAVLTATQDADVNYTAATATANLSVGITAQTITFGTLAEKTFGDATFDLTATASSGLAVSYASSNTAVATVSGNTVTIVGAGLANITANQTGDSNYSPATAVVQTLTVNKQAQVITFGTLAAKTYGDAAFTLSATGGTSGNPVLFTSSNPSVATCTGTNGATVTIIGAGNCTITANQAGNANYSVADAVVQSLTVNKNAQTITFGALAAKTYGDANFNLTGTASSTLAVSYNSDNLAVATVSGTTVTIVGAGIANITASQAGDGNFNAATNVVQQLTVAKANQVLTLNALPVGTLALKDFVGTIPVTASSSASLAVTISLGSGSAATLNASNELESIGATGTVVINVDQAGNGNYNAAHINYTFDVVVANQVITFPALTSATYAPGLTVDLTGKATSTSLLSVSYSVLSGPATVSGTTLSVTGAGFVVVQASQAGSVAFNPATDKTQTLIVSKATPLISSFAAITKIFDDAPFTLNATSASTGLFTYSSSDPDVATIAGSTVTIRGTGTAVLTATQDADVNYTAATATANLSVGITAQTITFGTLAEKTFGDATFDLTATASSGLAVSYASSNTAVATVSGNTVTIVGAGLANITANQTGDSNYSPATAVVQTLTVNKQAQVITFGTLAAKTYGDAAFNLTGTASSSLAVSYSSSNPAVATVSGTTVTIVGVGSTDITAIQAGDANHTAATNVVQTLVVNKNAQTISFGALADKSSGDGSFTLNGTSSSGLAVTYSNSNNSVATVSGNTVTIVGVGSTIITASQAGDANYNAATPVAQTLTVSAVIESKLNQYITFDAIPTKAFGDPSFTLSATGGDSGNPVVFMSSDPSIATCSGTNGKTVTITGIGSCTIYANQLGNSNYFTATPVGQTLTTKKGSQTILFSTLANKTIEDAPFTVSAVGGASGNPVIFTSSDNTIATCSGTNGEIVTIIGVGTCTITANQEGNQYYDVAVAAGNTLLVGKSIQTIVVNPLLEKKLGDTPFVIPASGGASGNPLTFSSSDDAVATCTGTNGETITLVGIGTCEIIASQAGNDKYNAANDAVITLNVTLNTGIGSQIIVSNLSAYAVRNIEIWIKGEVSRGAIATLYDMSGRVIRIATLEESSLNVMPTPGLKTAIYVLSVNDHGKIQTFKIPVRE